jgi:tetratricopeptide (TPR) repeat protein
MPLDQNASYDFEADRALVEGRRQDAHNTAFVAFEVARAKIATDYRENYNALETRFEVAKVALNNQLDEQPEEPEEAKAAAQWHAIRDEYDAAQQAFDRLRTTGPDFSELRVDLNAAMTEADRLYQDGLTVLRARYDRAQPKPGTGR